MAFFDFNKIEKKEYDTKIVTIAVKEGQSWDFKIQALGGLKFTKMTYDKESSFERVIFLLQNGTLKEETKVDSEGNESIVFVPAFKNRSEIEKFIENYPVTADRLAGEISIFTQESFAEFQEAKKNTLVDIHETDLSQLDVSTVVATD